MKLITLILMINSVYSLSYTTSEKRMIESDFRTLCRYDNINGSYVNFMCEYGHKNQYIFSDNDMTGIIRQLHRSCISSNEINSNDYFRNSNLCDRINLIYNRNNVKYLYFDYIIIVFVFLIVLAMAN